MLLPFPSLPVSDRFVGVDPFVGNWKGLQVGGGVGCLVGPGDGSGVGGGVGRGVGGGDGNCVGKGVGAIGDGVLRVSTGELVGSLFTRRVGDSVVGVCVGFLVL